MNVADITFEQLIAMNREEALEVFKQCPAPAPEEMRGEFKGLVMDYQRQAFLDFSDDNKKWFGKGYIPEKLIDGWVGCGYNIYETHPPLYAATRCLAFAWDIRNSGVDGKPALIMDYTFFDHISGEIKLIDEVRKVKDGLYIGAYYTPKAAYPFTLEDGVAEFFTLRGPVRDWVGYSWVEKLAEK